MVDKSTPLPGFTVIGGGVPPAPLVLSSPHSGRDYPAAFLAQTRLTMAQLRRAEDAFVDELAVGAAALGVPLLAARYGRAWLDLNRGAEELDPAMFVDPLDAHPSQASDRVQAGLGVLPKVAAQGLDIYAGRVRAADAAERIGAVYRPYHMKLAELLEAARRQHGFAVLIDCHSMPAPTPASGGAPQIVVGDLHGTSAALKLVERIERRCRLAGLRVARNTPYAGGHTTAFHGRPEAGVHAVQIEIDRTLYMDPVRLVQHMGFARIEAMLTDLVVDLLAEVDSLGLKPTLACAAE